MKDDLITTALVDSVSGTQIKRLREWLIVTFAQPQQILSWAVVRGGRTLARNVVWRQVSDGELDCPIDPHNFLVENLKKEGLKNSIGLLTSARLDDYVYVRKEFGLYWANCIVTAGMRNALCVSDFPTASNHLSSPQNFRWEASTGFHIGTINVLCQVSVPLSEGAFLEAISIAAEARTFAVLASGILSSRTQRSATGTGTDCIVIAAPDSSNGRKYAGKHTVLGHLIGSSVLEAVRSGIERWKARKNNL